MKLDLVFECGLTLDIFKEVFKEFEKECDYHVFNYDFKLDSVLFQNNSKYSDEYIKVNIKTLKIAKCVKINGNFDYSLTYFTFDEIQTLSIALDRLYNELFGSLKHLV